MIKRCEDSLWRFDHGKKLTMRNGHKYNHYVTSTKSHKVSKELNSLTLFSQKIAQMEWTGTHAFLSYKHWTSSTAEVC